MPQIGVYPASVTPMNSDGSVDSPSLIRLLAHFKASGCKGAVLAGTNGEGPSLSSVEKRDMVRVSVPVFADFEIIVGIATASLPDAIWLSQQSHKAGASAALVMAPSYFREASVEGLCAWFESLFEESDLPVLVYNFPQRTGIEIGASMIERLAKHPQMIGLKDSSGNAANIRDYAKALEGTDKMMYVGNETLLWDALEAGWAGTISGAANCIAPWLAAVIQDYSEGNTESARTKFELTLKGIDALRGVPQPQINKAVLERMEILPNSSVRLPLQQAPIEQVTKAWADLESLRS
ncbi:MAG: hypothetical protein BGO01_19360 [Armatimonadetes bacterium 55-13]|nr:dihydrodipicolinate synthase family protein [Armatimonadota bacterium]OJU64275.1 MAG: hypothetical protein BGO01_19360 [Armatimonadetes bacterium 55-13]